ncbi:MAG: T9SS type A sorting domain-containing protein [Flavobacteriaceae bacterium]|nr:T9SS type A sorting domain-containing protein [Flavobacteriaceae bacterium]
MLKLLLITTFVTLSASYATATGDDGLLSRNNATVVAVDNPFRLNFYPNPCPKTLNVDIGLDKSAGSLIEIRFRNLIGKEMTQVLRDENVSSNNHYEIDLTDLPSGIYLMEVTSYTVGVPSKVTKRITKL